MMDGEQVVEENKDGTSTLAGNPHHWYTNIQDEDETSSQHITADENDHDDISLHYTRTRNRHQRRIPYEDVSITSTRSLYSNEREYIYENGRRYAGNYFMPNDEMEQTRLNIVHQAYLFIFHNHLTTVPLSAPTRILDIGTGTGEWAIEMGEAHPSAEILGTDLSAIQPSNVPSNIFFEIDDAEDDTGWTFGTDAFDLIHLRNMNGAFRDWDSIYCRALTHLKPGAYVEVVDFDDHAHLAAHFGADSDMLAFIGEIAEAARKSGCALGTDHLGPQRLIDAGFEDVSLQTYDIPLVGQADDAQRSTARLWLVACSAGMESTALRLLTREGGWTAEEVRRKCEVLIEDLKSVVRDPVRGKGLCVKVNVLVGRKPGGVALGVGGGEGGGEGTVTPY